MPEHNLMHVREIKQAAREAEIEAGKYTMKRRPWWRPRLRRQDDLANAYQRGLADMARRVLTGHVKANGGAM